MSDINAQDMFDAFASIDDAVGNAPHTWPRHWMVRGELLELPKELDRLKEVWTELFNMLAAGGKISSSDYYVE